MAVALVQRLLAKYLNLENILEGNQDDFAKVRWNGPEFSHSRILSSLRCFLFLLNMDLFDVYKRYFRNPERRQNKRDLRIYANNLLRLKPTNWDHWRPTVNNAISCLICYCVAKIMLLSVFIPAILESYPCSEQIRSHQLERQTGPSSKHNDFINQISCQLEKIELIVPLSDLIKVFFATLAVISFSLRTFFVNQQKTCAFNVPTFRFMFKPQHELIRVDLLTRDLLDELRVSMVFFRAAMMQSLRKSSSIDGLNTTSRAKFESLGFIMVLLEDDRRQLAVQMSEPEKIAQLRPKVYKLFWYKICRQVSVYLYMFIMSSAHFIGLIFMAAVTHIMYTSCGLYRDCKIGFAWIQFGIECASIVPFNIHPYIVSLITCPIMLATHLKLISDIKLDLKCNLNKLRALREQLSDSRHPVGQDYHDDSPTLLFNIQSSSSIDSSGDESCKAQMLSREQQVFSAKFRANKIMFGLLVRLVIDKHELISGSHAIGAAIEGPISAIWALIYAVIAIEYFRTAFVFFPRYVLLPVVLIIVNIMSVSCAYCTARLTELEQLTWSILAESISIHSQQHGDVKLWRPTGGLGFSSVLWRRYALNADYWRQVQVPRPWDQPVTYHNILEANFFLISFISIFFRH